jgi:uncharacterized protein (TIGR02246 family)
MSTDEQAIRDRVALWHSATATGDIDTVMGLMAEDVIFLLAGKPPIRGRASFVQALRTVLTQHRIESKGDIQEIGISGSLAYCWTNITVRIVPLSGGKGTLRAGSTLSILHKQPSGSWVVVRDANLLPPLQ